MPHSAPQDALARLESTFEQGDLAAIKTQISALEKAHPKDGRVGVARARLSAAQGDVAAATSKLEELAKDPEDGTLANAYLGALMVAQRRHAEGRALLEAALSAGVDVPAARHALGVALAAAGRSQEAVVHLAKAVERMPGNAPTYFYLCVCTADLAQWDHAVEALGACIKLQPAYEEAYDAWARVELSRGSAEKAKAALAAGLKANKDSPGLLRSQAELLSQLGDAKGALDALKKLPAKDLQAQDHVNTSLMAMGVGDGALALKHAEAAVKADPNLWSAHYAHGIALEAQTPLPRPKMVAAYRKAVAAGDPAGEAGSRLGFVLMEEDTPATKKEAVEVLEAAVERSSEAPGAVLNLAIAYGRNGQKAQAKAMCAVVLADAGASPSDKEQAQRLLKAVG